MFSTGDFGDLPISDVEHSKLKNLVILYDSPVFQSCSGSVFLSNEILSCNQLANALSTLETRDTKTALPRKHRSNVRSEDSFIEQRIVGTSKRYQIQPPKTSVNVYNQTYSSPKPS